MKRRPLLYVINFLLPIVFFLTLDLASFFIADHRGEKLGFKVTVLLAISVLLLILNDILPSMSNKTPLIGTAEQRSRLDQHEACSSLSSCSHLLHRDFHTDAAQPAGNHSGDLPDGQKQTVGGQQA